MKNVSGNCTVMACAPSSVESNAVTTELLHLDKKRSFKVVTTRMIVFAQNIV